MRIGCCCNIEDAAIAYGTGFDYIECKVVSLLPEENREAVTSILDQHRSSPVPVASFNFFMPGDLKIVGPAVDSARLGRYVESALARVHKIGAKMVVIGSGGARAIPDGFSVQEARRQMVRFLQQVADAAEKNDITVVIEPLNRKESNSILTVAEGVELAREVDRPYIKVLADFYHMDEEQEPLAHLTRYKDWIKHIHVADTARLAPGTGQYPYAEFADRLRQNGYDGMVSIECRWINFAAEAPLAVEFLRRTLI
jgi:sugar phosphate isomerase/epimerase